MSEHPDQPENSESPETTPPPRKKRRRWLKVLAGLFVLLLLLIVLLPTIASTGPVRSFVLGKVNEQINGKVEIDSWSLGWFSSMSATGIKVYDDNQQLILNVPRVKLGISLLNAVRQNFAMGDDNVIEVESFVMRMDDAGRSNLERLPRERSAPRPETKGGRAVEVPNLSGKFTVNFNGTVESETGKFAPIHVRDSSALVTITDINQPITSAVKIGYVQGQGEPSRIETSGTVAAIRNNLLNLDQFAAAQNVSLSNVNLSALEPFLKQFGVDARIAGIINGGVDVKAQGLTGLSTSGEIVINGLMLAGGPLGKDTFQTPRIAIPVNITRTPIEGGDSQIKFENVGLKMNQATVTVTGQVTEKSLRNLIDHKAPGADGSITLTADITDFKDLAGQLKNTLQLQEGVTVNGGSGHEQLTVLLTKDNVKITQDLKIAATGTRGAQSIELKPITVAASATAIPNGKPIPDIKDIKLNVNSTFATVTGGGDSLAKLAITGKVALNALSSELSQFVDMQKVQLQGGGEFALNTDGDLGSDTAPIQVTAEATFQNVRISGLADSEINQDRLRIDAKGTIKREAKIPVRIEPAWATISSGDPAAPLLDMDANVIVNLKDMTLPWFELKKCTITSLPKLQEQYGGLVPQLAEQKIKIESGALYASAAGSFDGTTLTFSKPAGLSIPAFSVNQEGRSILNREIVRITVNGKISLKDGVAGEFSDLSLTTESKLVTLTKGGQGPLTFTMIQNKDGSIVRGNGVMTLAADLKRLADLAQAFGGTVMVSPDQPQIRTGALNGTITLTKTTEPQTDLTFDGQITSLTIANAAGPIAQNEQLTINLTAFAPDDLNAHPISANAKVTGSFVNATVSDAKVGLNGSALDMVRSAMVDAQITDLAKAYGLVSAATGTRGSTSGPASPPLQVTGGSAVLRMNVTRDLSSKTTSVTITDAQITRLALKKGTKPFAFDPNTPITAKLNAAIKGSEKADSIEIKQLSADARIATLSMPEPIIITDPTSDKPTYQGSIAVKGKLEDATPLLAMFQQADPMPYRGSYDMIQKLVTQPANGAIKLTGSADIRDFRVMSGDRPAFSEPQVSIRNDIGIVLIGKKLQAEVLTLNMPQSQALGLSFTGGVNDWEKARQIRPNTKLDVTYDLEKIWTIVRPMLSLEQQATYKDLKVAGKYQKSFTLSGAFPDGPIDKSFAALSADGSLTIDSFDTMGLNIQKLQPTVKMTRGKVLLQAPPATANEGILDISGIAMDLTQPSPVMSIPRNKKLLANVRLNPVLANSLGMFASVIFTGTNDASGLCDVMVLEFNQVPISTLASANSNARARIVFSVRDLRLDSIPMQVVGAALGFGSGGIRGRIPESTMTLADGVATSDVAIELDRDGERQGQREIIPSSLRFAGGMGLAKFDLRDFVVAVPTELLPREVRQFLPGGLKVPLTGTAEKPKFDLGKAIAANAGSLIPGLGGGGNQDPLKNLGNILEQLGGQRNENPQDQPRPRGRGQ